MDGPQGPFEETGTKRGQEAGPLTLVRASPKVRVGAGGCVQTAIGKGLPPARGSHVGASSPAKKSADERDLAKRDRRV